ncbi:Ribosomal protein L11 methyltransferase [Gammaproteobacteria bacterium]
MPWLQLTIDIDPAHAPEVESLLEDAGALAVSLADAADDPLYEPPLGTSPLWSHTRIIGLFETSAAPAVIVAQVAQELGQEPVWQVQWVADQDWERAWLEDFHPLSCGTRLWVCPSGWPVPHPDAVILWLDPGLAFGTGTHPTTALCLEWLDASLQSGATVVDYGCGSGILGLAALRLGAARAWAVDNDPQALLATIDNAAKNDITIQTTLSLAITPIPEISIAFPLKESDALLWVGPPEHLPQVKADLLLANILARPLIELAPRLETLVRPGGNIVLSGILADQEQSIIAAYQPWFDFHPTIIREGWICLTGIHR